VRTIALLVLVVAACGSRERERERRAAQEEQVEALEQSLDRLEAYLGIVDAAPAEPPPDEPPPEAPAPEAPAVADAPEQPAALCLDPDAIDSVRLAGATTRVCQRFDDQAEAECFTLSRAGAVVTAETVPAAETAHVTAIDRIAEVCPPGRPCVRISPRLRDGELLEDARASDDGARAALVIADPAGTPVRLELWDVARGRRTGSADIADLGAPSDEGLSIEHAPGALVVLGYQPGDDGLARGALFGLDGTRRATLGGAGGGILNWAVTDRMVAVFTLGAEDLGEAIGYDLATGKRIGAHALTPIPDDYLDMDEAGGRRVVLVFAARVVVVDLATGKPQSRPITTCP
jgi:hypothetical protein